MSENVEDFAEKWFSADLGKAVPLDLLRAWLSQNHDHKEDGTAFVPSMDLDRWARSVAVTRVVDHGPDVGDKEVWSFFEDGWHKTGCETRLTQQSARIVRVDEDVAQKIQDGMINDYSIAGDAEEPVRYRRESSTTGRLHWCELPPEETCYWSGDPYAPHELGF